MNIFTINEEQYILHNCPICEGDGVIVTCLEPEKHDDGYKDSFEQAEEEQKGHKHKVEPCKCCKGLCVVLIPLAKITILLPKKESDGEVTI